MDKNIVFDFDETIGYFEQIIEIIIHKKTSIDVTKDVVFELFTLFPLVFRTNIFDIFHYIVGFFLFEISKNTTSFAISYR